MSLKSWWHRFSGEEGREIKFSKLNNLEARPSGTRNFEDLLGLVENPDIPKKYENECFGRMDQLGSFSDWTRVAVNHDPHYISWRDARYDRWHRIHLHAIHQCGALATTREEISLSMQFARAYDFSDVGETYTRKLEFLLENKIAALN